MLVRRVQHDRRHGVIADDGGQFQRSLLAECLHRFGINIRADPVLMEQSRANLMISVSRSEKRRPSSCCI